MCTNEVDQKLMWMREEETQASIEMAFHAYWIPLEIVTALKYLGRVLTISDDNWLMVVSNIWKAQIR